MDTSLAMSPTGVTNGEQWCALLTLPCIICRNRTQWRTGDRALCLTCHAASTRKGMIMTETEYRERCATIEAEYDAAIRKARRQADRLALYVERQKRLDNLTWRFQRSQLTEA